MRRHGMGGAALLGLALGAFILASSATAQTIVQQAQLLPNGSAGDQAGFSVAVDGDTMVVGAPYDDVDGNADQGSAYVYARVDGAWVLQARLAPGAAGPGLLFGYAVDVHRDRIVVGAPHHASPGVGKAHFFVRDGGDWRRHWTETGVADTAFGFSVGIYLDTAVVGIPKSGAGAIRIVSRLGTPAPEVQDLDLGVSPGDRAGYSVAISGQWVACGAPLATWNGHAEQGRVIVLTFIDGDVWFPVGDLAPAAGVAGERFGTSVSLHFGTMAVGAYAKAGSRGAAYVFTNHELAWTEQQTLMADDGASGDMFGWDVAVSGDTVLVGAPKDHVGAAADEGSVYVYTRSGTTWTQRAHGTGVGAAANDNWGHSVDLSGTTAAVGAPYDDVGAAANQGSATVFTGSGATWTPTAWLSGYGPEAAAYFGGGVAISGNTLAVGAPWESPGHVYVFGRSGGSWLLQARLASSDGIEFGASVALSGDTLVAGAPRTSGAGAAYVFTRSGDTWTERARLVASDAAAEDHLGSSVALSGSVIAVGANVKDVAGKVNAGAVYVFERSGDTWSERGRLTSPTPSDSLQFGDSVSVSGTTVIVGAPLSTVEGRSVQGAAFVFTKTVATWGLQAVLSSPVAAPSQHFGSGVAVEGDTALVGRPLSGGGAVDVFARTGTAWVLTDTLVSSAVWREGIAVALDGDTAVVGATLDASTAGALVVFTRAGGTWREVQHVHAAGGKGEDYLGAMVAISGDVVVGGAPPAAVLDVDLAGFAAVYSGVCQFGITPQTITPGAAAASQSVTVNAGSSTCAWSTSSQAAWLTFDAPATGTGDGAVTIRYTANTGPARTGTMTIAGETFTVNQAGGCTFTLGATSAPSGAVGGNGGVSFTASNAACPWTAASNVPWMSVTPPDTGTGSGAIAYAVLPNAGPARSGTLTIAGQTFTVNQEGGCSFSLTPSSATAVAAGGTSTIQVSASDAACAWSASSNVAWLSAPLGNGGVGSATFTWAAAGNLGPARAGTMTIAGLTFTVNQANGCTYFVTPEDVSVSALGGFASLALVASDGACPWTAVSNVTWAAISSAPSGTGSATVNVAVEPNTGAARSGTLTVAGRTIDVVQAAWGCTFAVTPLAIDAPAAGLSGTVSITAAHPACAWTVGSAPDWISFPAGSSGSGSATLAYHVAANYTSTQRQAAFSVGGQVVSVTQAGSGCGFSLSPTALTFPVNATTRTLAISASDAGCAWTAATTSAWLVVSPASGTGAGTVTVLATANDDTARTGSVEVAGGTVSVQQDGSATPSGAMTRYLAEGATTDFFDMRLALLNTGNTPDEVTLRYLTRDGATPSQSVTVPPLTRATVWPETLLGAAEFSTVVESSGPIVVDRTMTWDARGYGSHAETAVAGPALEWFLAEGATHSGFDLFYLVQNPNAAPAEVEVRYLRPAPQPQLTRTYTVNPNTRFNIWVDYEDPALADTDLSAVVRSINGQPIIVERAMYKSVAGHRFNAGHESAGITSPATRWLLAEGATGPYFDLFVLLANPDVRAADVRVTYLLPDGTTYTKAMTLPGESRSNIWVDYDTPDGTTGLPLNDTAVSTTVEVTNGVPIIVERAMWWPTGPATWFEAHNSAGATAAGTRWALAEGEAGGPNATETYILIANTSPTAGEALVTLLFEDGTSAHRTYALPALSRTNVPVLFDFPQSAGRRFGAIVETLGETPAQIVVERAVYSDAEGIHWAAGSNALATRLR